MSMHDLLPYQVEHVLEALRRDARREADAAITDPEWASWHRSNARHDISALEAINPKRPTIDSFPEFVVRTLTDLEAKLEASTPSPQEVAPC